MEKIAQLFEEAERQHQTGNLQAALELYQTILSLDPKHIPTLHGLAILLAQFNQNTEALTFIEQALRLQPKSAELHTSKANILLRLGDYFSAEAALKAAIHHAPQYAPAYNNLGNALYHQRLFDEAIEAYQTALQLQPNLIDAQYNLASLYSNQDRTEAAIQLLKQILNVNPQHPKALIQLAKIYYNQATYTESIYYFREALKQQINNAELQHDLGLALLAHKDYAAAIEHFLSCLKIDEHHSEAHYHLATAYLETEDLQNALTHYMQQLAIHPTLDTYYNIGVLLTTQQRNEEAIPYFEEVLRLNPDYQNAHLNLGVIHLKFNRQKEAIHHYKAALKINPADSEINYILAGLSQSEEVPSTAPPEYLSHLFDQYALYYDKHLKEHLQYQVPKEILESLKTNTEIENAHWNILDLGCGTGLSGILLQPFAKKLIGIDISENMLDLAEQKNIYTQLEKADISTYLAQATGFDLIVAADVFSYHGELEVLFKEAARVLNDKGYFIFSVERGFKYPYHLQQSLRYTHSKQYLEELIQKYNFNCLSFDNLILRYQQKEAVEGYLILLQK